MSLAVELKKIADTLKAALPGDFTQRAEPADVAAALRRAAA